MSSPTVTPDAPAESLSGLDPIPLPETRRTGRARQRAERRRQARRRFLRTALAVAGAVAMVAGVVALVAGDDHGPVRGPGQRAAAAPAVPPLLFAVQGASGRATSLFVLVPDRAGGGTLLLVPPGTMTEVASLGLEPVGRALELGDAPRLLGTVENLLGTSLGEVVVADGARLAALVQPAGSVTVDVPQRVERVEGEGRVEEVFPSGPVVVAPADVPRLLEEKGRTNDLARLARHQAFFEAWLRLLAAKPQAVPADPPALGRALRVLARGRVTARVVPVTAIATSDVDGELYEVDQEQLAELVDEVFPDERRAAAGGRPRVQILNGAGSVGLAQKVGAKLGPGFQVKLTGNAPTFDHAETQIIFYDREQQAAAERVRKALGMGTLVLSRRPLDVVDVTIIVGKDFASAP